MQFRNDGDVTMAFKNSIRLYSKGSVLCKFNENQKICIVRCLESYLHITSKFRSSDKTKPDPLLRTLVNPHRGLSANTAGSWIKQVRQLTGIVINKFKTHSTKGMLLLPRQNTCVSQYQKF